MPIRPENRARYPADWPQISMQIRARAGQCCEACGVSNHAWGWRGVAGAFHQVGKRALIEAGFGRPPFDLWITIEPGWTSLVRVIEIVLTVAHLDHTPENCDPANLRAWCQRCHNIYDAKHRAQTRRVNATGQAEFFAA